MMHQKLLNINAPNYQLASSHENVQGILEEYPEAEAAQKEKKENLIHYTMDVLLLALISIIAGE